MRYVVLDTGKWLSGRLVLIPLWALHAPDWDQARIPVRLTRAQVQRSPDIDTHRPVSRQAEATSLSYYGYPFYWGGPACGVHCRRLVWVRASRHRQCLRRRRTPIWAKRICEAAAK